MTKFNLVIVENERNLCLGNDVTDISITDNELAYVYENGECEDIYSLDNVESIIIKVGR